MAPALRRLREKKAGYPKMSGAENTVVITLVVLGLAIVGLLVYAFLQSPA